MNIFERDWFLTYVAEYYLGKKSIFPIEGINRKLIQTATKFREDYVKLEICYDTFDREVVRDIMLFWKGFPLENLEYEHLIKPAVKRCEKINEESED